MILFELHRKLIAAARAAARDDNVPYAFEKRIMAHLSSARPFDQMEFWGRAFSHAAVYSVIFMLFLSAGSFLLPSTTPDSLSQDVDKTLLAAVDNNTAADQQDAW